MQKTSGFTTGRAFFGDQEEVDRHEDSSCTIFSANSQTGKRRALAYQKNWSDEYAEEADLVLIVQEVELPAHSSVLHDSEFVQNYLKKSSCVGEQRRVEDLFWGVKLGDMIEYLCLVYPDADNYELANRAPGVLEIARRLGSQNVVDTMKSVSSREDTPEDSIRDSSTSFFENVVQFCTHPMVTTVAVPLLFEYGPKLVRWISKSCEKKNSKKEETERNAGPHKLT